MQRLWHEKAAEGRLPALADFSIDDLRPWMGRLILVDILPDGNLFYRVHGTKLAEQLGQELTGKYLTDLADLQLRAAIRSEYALVAARRAPMVFRRRRHYGNRGSYDTERIVLPLSHGGNSVDQALSLADWLPETLKPALAAPTPIGSLIA
ncbi:MAG TPA: PAS domain-containing protein [Aliidongia sp.]|nr:PAS domain-containing protein [Aliidongia sp.]